MRTDRLFAYPSLETEELSISLSAPIPLLLDWKAKTTGKSWQCNLICFMIFFLNDPLEVFLFNLIYPLPTGTKDCHFCKDHVLCRDSAAWRRTGMDPTAEQPCTSLVPSSTCFLQALIPQNTKWACENCGHLSSSSAFLGPCWLCMEGTSGKHTWHLVQAQLICLSH